jgi:hypothetical protein
VGGGGAQVGAGSLDRLRGAMRPRGHSKGGHGLAPSSSAAPGAVCCRATSAHPASQPATSPDQHPHTPAHPPTPWCRCCRSRQSQSRGCPPATRPPFPPHTWPRPPPPPPLAVSPQSAPPGRWPWACPRRRALPGSGG